MTYSQILRFFFTTVLLVTVCFSNSVRGEVARGDNHFVIDGVKIPVGSEIEIIGPIRRSGSRRYRSSGYAAIHGMWIDGKANQDEIMFDLCRAKPGGWPEYKDFKALERDKFYKIRGKIIEGRIYCLRKAITLVVKQIEPALPREIRFSDLVDRETTFDGTAASGGMLKTIKDQAQIANLTDWPKTVAGKPVFVRGTLRKSQTGFLIEGAKWHLIDIRELVGQSVTLEGILPKDPNPWRFKYRWDYLYLKLSTNNLLAFDKRFRKGRVRVTGKLVLEDLPELNQYGRKKKGPDVPCLMIQEAMIEFLEKKIFEDESDKLIYGTLHSISQGVPELIAEPPYPSNRQTNPADAYLYFRRNHEVINNILAKATPQTCDVLSGRLKDEKISRTIRLLYASMLAHLNDKRGRSFLVESLKDHGKETLPDALYCLGAFPSFGTKEMQSKTEIRWAEKPMISLMSNREPFDVGIYFGFPGNKNFLQTIADAAVIYSDVPILMLKMNAPAAQRAIVDYLVSSRTSFWNGTTGTMNYNLYRSLHPPIPAEDLKILEQYQAEIDARRK